MRRTIIMTHENLTASTVPPFAVSVGGNFPYGEFCQAQLCPLRL